VVRRRHRSDTSGRRNGEGHTDKSHSSWPHKKELLGLLAEATDKELRWHLAVIVPRLSLTIRERQRASTLLQEYLKDRSSIVKTFALQGLADLSENDPSLKANARELLRASGRTGTSAMKARRRKLLLHLENR
jgi:hypothetical protein